MNGTESLCNDESQRPSGGSAPYSVPGAPTEVIQYPHNYWPIFGMLLLGFVLAMIAYQRNYRRSRQYIRL
jgi:hypothetical protein